MLDVGSAKSMVHSWCIAIYAESLKESSVEKDIEMKIYQMT